MRLPFASAHTKHTLDHLVIPQLSRPYSNEADSELLLGMIRNAVFVFHLVIKCFCYKPEMSTFLFYKVISFYYIGVQVNILWILKGTPVSVEDSPS